MTVVCSVAQAKAFLNREAQRSAEDAAVKAPLCCDFHSSSDEEQLAEVSRPVTSSTRYVNPLVLAQSYVHVSFKHKLFFVIIWSSVFTVGPKQVLQNV
jgi:hypothetical protein